MGLEGPGQPSPNLPLSLIRTPSSELLLQVKGRVPHRLLVVKWTSSWRHSAKATAAGLTFAVTRLTPRLGPQGLWDTLQSYACFKFY